jgi:hypothetical protein
VTLKAIEAIRRLQQNPHLGEFRIHAALAQIGLHLSPRTCGRVLALNRELYGLEKPKGPAKEKREMPFAARRRHQFWSANVPYVANDRVGGRAYVISVLDNHSRAISSRAPSLGRRTSPPTSRSSTRPSSATARPRLFENSHGLNCPQQHLFALESLGEAGWLKALKLRGYVARGPRRPPALQRALFAYAEAL